MTDDIKTLSVLATGYTPLDLIVTSSEPTVANARRAGGTAGNVAAISALLGCTTGLLAEVGGDAAGDELVADLRTSGVDLQFVRRRGDLLTARIVHEVLPGPRTHRFWFRCPACHQGFPRTLRPHRSLIDEVITSGLAPKVVFVDRAWKQLTHLAGKLRDRGSLVFFEPQRLKDVPDIRAAVATADVVKINHFAADRTLELLHEAGVKAVLVTRGPRGAVLYVRREAGGWHQRTYESPIVPSPVDTAGAGDWCSSVLIASLAEADAGVDVSAVLHTEIPRALAIASRSVAFVGARGLAQDASTLSEFGISAPRFLAGSSSWPQACALCLLAVPAAAVQPVVVRR